MEHSTCVRLVSLILKNNSIEYQKETVGSNTKKCIELKNGNVAAEDIFVGVGDWDKDALDPGEVLVAVLRLTLHPEYKYFTKTF